LISLRCKVVLLLLARLSDTVTVKHCESTKTAFSHGKLVMPNFAPSNGDRQS